MGYRHDLWEIAAAHHGVVTVMAAEDMGVPAVEVRKLAARGALEKFGQGVYRHLGVPRSSLTQPTIAVALGGQGAFLNREAVLDLLGLGQFNPKRIRVGTQRRVRRNLPDWMILEQRNDIPDDQLTTYEGIVATTVGQALRDVEQRMPRERWVTVVEEAIHRELIAPHEVPAMVEDIS